MACLPCRGGCPSSEGSRVHGFTDYQFCSLLPQKLPSLILYSNFKEDPDHVCNAQSSAPSPKHIRHPRKMFILEVTVNSNNCYPKQVGVKPAPGDTGPVTGLRVPARLTSTCGSPLSSSPTQPWGGLVGTLGIRSQTQIWTMHAKTKLKILSF